MGRNSIRQTVKTVSAWRDSLEHIKERKKKQAEKNWPVLQTLAKLAGDGITKNGQAKGKSFRYDLKKK